MPQFASSVLSMWLTHVSKKNKTTLGASQSSMTQNKKENARNPIYPIFFKKKIHTTPAPRFPKEKYPRHLASPHWLSMILILKFVGHHFCHTLMARALISIHSENLGSSKACYSN